VTKQVRKATSSANKPPANKPPAKATARKSKPKPAARGEASPSGWARLSKGMKALVALIGTTAIAAVVPGVLPYASDRVLDLSHSSIVDIRSEIGSSTHGLAEAAVDVMPTAPEQVTGDPRFVPAGYALTRLTLEGKRSARVAVLDASVEIVDRLPPRRGTLFYIDAQGEDDNTVVDLNLDTPRPVLVAPGGGGPYFVGKHITLGRGELWVIEVQSRTTRHEYAWRLHLRLRYRGSDREVTVPPTGSPPLRMTAFVPPGEYRQQFVWDVNGNLIRVDCAVDKPACAAREMPRVSGSP
jgi:hypothetical protein